MVLEGRISNDTDPMAISLRGMIKEISLVGFATDNIAYADLPGYQRKKPVITTFADHLGFKGIDTQIDTSVGRLHNTTRPLDFALETQGYFQKLSSNGQVELTRDGRFRLDKDGVLISDDNKPILSRHGMPIKMPYIPDKLERIKVNTDGSIQLYNPATAQSTLVGQMGIATDKGSVFDSPIIHQGHVEESNVALYEEYSNLVGQGIAANRQMFLNQSQELSRLIQEMGRTQ